MLMLYASPESPLHGRAKDLVDMTLTKLDVLDGLGDEVSARAPLLAEERQLLVAPVARAPELSSAGIVSLSFSPFDIFATASSQPLMTLPRPSSK